MNMYNKQELVDRLEALESLGADLVAARIVVGDLESRFNEARDLVTRGFSDRINAVSQSVEGWYHSDC